MAGQLPPVFQRIIDKFSNSRDFTISFALHAILVFSLGGAVLFEAVQEPPDFEGGGDFVQGDVQVAAPPPDQIQQPPEMQVTTPPPPTSSPMDVITVNSANPTEFSMEMAMVAPPPMTPVEAPAAPQPPKVSADSLTPAMASSIKDFTQGWGKKGGPGTGTRNREFEFTAYIGQYAGGNWNSTVRVLQNRIETGSLPNLLYLMSHWSKDKIKTNYRQVKAIKLDSPEIFSVKPPFIFITGTRDFVLTDKEVETLQQYVRLGGCIWGDSSVPGLRSRFDIAFRREMKRVIPDVDKDFQPLPATHPIYTQGYFADVKAVPPGLNFYKLPVYALSIYGEIAILYTANDYGDMWQIGLDADGKIDVRRDAQGRYVAINNDLYGQRDVYVRNITPEALATSYKFGTNVIVHLLTRWENKTRSAPSL